MLAHGIETVAYGFLFWLAVLLLAPVIVSVVLVRSAQVPRWFSLMVLLVTFGISLLLVYPVVAGLSGATPSEPGFFVVMGVVVGAGLVLEFVAAVLWVRGWRRRF